MPDTVYKTSDGALHESRGSAEVHQGWINSGLGFIGGVKIEDHVKSNEYFDSGAKLFNENKYDEAISAFNISIKYAEKRNENDRKSSPLGFRGMCYFKKGDYNSAITDLAEAISMCSDIGNKGTFLNFLGCAYNRKGDKEQAIKSWRLSTDNSNKDAIENLKNNGVDYSQQQSSSSSSTPNKSEDMLANFTGKGKFTDEYGNIYEGDFVNGKLHGKGKHVYPSGDLEEGNFDEGSLTVGKQIEKGIVYEGNFKGYVEKLKITYPDGNIYEGEVHFNFGYKPHGKGVMTYPDGKVEKGNFKEGNYKKGLFG